MSTGYVTRETCGMQDTSMLTSIEDVRKHRDELLARVAVLEADVDGFSRCKELAYRLEVIWM